MIRRLVLACTALLAVGGCAFTGIYDIPLPGGADVGDHPYRVRAQFRDVLDLVPQSGVKVNEVAVGRVEDIALAADGWTAEVTMLVNGDVALPANALAKLRQSSLLGEKYVELSPPPPAAATGRLADGALIPVNRTNRNTEVEEVLGALSMLLNGGGVEQLQNISRELNAALEGNEQNIRAALDNVTVFVSTLDASRAEITRAIDGLNRLAGTLAAQRDQIAGAIDNLGPGLRVLADQREQLVTMLQALDSLSAVAVDTVDRAQADIVADLKALMPALAKLGEAGNDLPKALELLLTIPFPDEAVNDVRGDYFNLFAKIDLNLQSVIDNLSRSRNNPLGNLAVPGAQAPPAAPAVPFPLPPIGPLPGAPAPPSPGATCGFLDALLGRCAP
ncbi:MAG TPA: MCE family protein [Actinophytocola sp.]|uniref:MCE family protein n=1 Tax=Actinophytocola sp. TaxID=1872138 RepID=UPI002DBCEF4B|nr:MCE family protein [Actinophytocola sp.]HEU5469581.1 MCE family protein [Actinophytocola sp.]